MSSRYLRGKRSLVDSSIRLMSLPALFAAVLAAPLAAQSGAGVSPDSRPQREWGEHGGHPRHRMGRLDAVQGPASPAILRDTVQLTGEKLQQYTKQYDAYMASTKVTRDSLRSNLQAMRSAFQQGDRSGARDRRDTIKQQAKSLSQRDQEFEKSLKALLSKDQQKRYAKWKDDQQRNERERWRQHAGRSGEDSTLVPANR
jgi:hypothetical protein